MTRHIVHPLRCDARHSWLPALLPATARRIRVEDPELRATLTDAGADVVAQEADVEIAPPFRVRASAPHVLVPIGRAGEPALEGWPRVARGARRAAVSALVRAAAGTSAAALRRRGFRITRLFMWDVERPLGGGRLPLGAVVAADRTEQPVPVVDAIAADVDGWRPAASPRISSWGIVCVGVEGVLRVAVGPGRRVLAAQARAIESLAGTSVDRQFHELIPWLLRRGTTGLAEWSLERRVPGSPLVGELPEPVLGECLDLVATLHALEDRTEPGALAEAVAVVAPLTGGLDARLRTLAEQLHATLEQLPSTFAHGDLSPANLLVQGGRLAGVVDWNKARGGRAPLHDLLNLRLAVELQRTGSSFGTTFTDWLLPLMRAGGDALIRSHCARVGVDGSPRLLTALATAYWLQRVADQITTYADRERRPGWVRDNVVRPAAAVVAARAA